MKAKNIPIFERQALEILPVTQVELWKRLGISSQDGADLIEIMLNKKLVKRSPIKKTFLIEHANGNGKCEKGKGKPTNPFAALLNGKVFSPCTACPELHCQPQSCTSLGLWVATTPSS